MKRKTEVKRKSKWLEQRLVEKEGMMIRKEKVGDGGRAGGERKGRRKTDEKSGRVGLEKEMKDRQRMG